MWSKIKYLFWKIKNRKMLKELGRQIKTQVFFEAHPRTDCSFNDYLIGCMNKEVDRI